MKKKTLLTAASISILLVAVSGILLVNLVRANMIIPSSQMPAPAITVTSPQNGGSYNSSTIDLTFTVWVQSSVDIGGPYLTIPKLSSITCIVDDREMQFDNEDISKPFSTTLTGLSEGIHQIKISASVSWVFDSPSGSVYGDPKFGNALVPFTVDTKSPSVSGLSLQDTIDGAKTLKLLNFTVSEAVSWIGYSLDGKDPVTITENTEVTPNSHGRYDCYAQLTGLPDSEHILTVQVKDAAGNTGESNAISLGTAQETQSNTEQQPFPTIAVVASVCSVAAVGAVLILYFKKKHP